MRPSSLDAAAEAAAARAPQQQQQQQHEDERASLLRGGGGVPGAFSIERPPAANGANGLHHRPARPSAPPPAATPPPAAYPLESLDFEPVDNAVAAADEAMRGPLSALATVAARWLVVLLAGAATAAAAFCINVAVELLAGGKFGAALAFLRAGRPVSAFLLLALVNCVLVGAAAAITSLWAPEAAGSGIAEVKSFLNGIDVPGLFAGRTLVAKLVGMVGAVAGGLAVGKEGPSLHAGAAIAALLSQGGSAARRSPALRRFWNGQERAAVVACGSAAGIAAAFRAPLGGVLFALEGVCAVWQRSNPLLAMAFATTACASVALRALMGACTAAALLSDDPAAAAARCGFFGAAAHHERRQAAAVAAAGAGGRGGVGGGGSGGGNAPAPPFPTPAADPQAPAAAVGGASFYDRSEGAQDAYVLAELLPVVLLGVLGGLLGGLFNHVQLRLAKWRARAFAIPAAAAAASASAAERKAARRRAAKLRVAEAVLAALATSAALFALPLAARCRPCPASSGASTAAACPRPAGETSGSFVALGCPARDGGYYNDLATLTFNTADDAIRALFSPSSRAGGGSRDHPHHEFSVGSLAAFSAVYYSLALYSYGLSLPTGLFVPSILCGAAYGRLVGIFVAQRHGARARVDEGTYALLGAAGLLGGSMRLTVAPCVMLLELTGSPPALLPLVMLVLLVAKGVGDGTAVPGTYEAALDAKGLPFLPELAEAGEWVAAAATADDDDEEGGAGAAAAGSGSGAGAGGGMVWNGAGGLAGLMRHVTCEELVCGSGGGGGGGIAGASGGGGAAHEDEQPHAGAVVGLRRVERVGRIVAVLATTRHCGFPVFTGGRSSASGGARDGIDEEEDDDEEQEAGHGRRRPGKGVRVPPPSAARNQPPQQQQQQQHLYGLVLRSQLLVLLRARRCLQPSPHVHAEAAARLAFSFRPGDFAAPMAAASPPPPPLGEEEDGNDANGPDDPYLRRAGGDMLQAARLLRLSAEDLTLYLDLGPYANRSPHTVPADAPLSKAYQLVRALGLRHLLVVSPAHSGLVGGGGGGGRLSMDGSGFGVGGGGGWSGGGVSGGGGGGGAAAVVGMLTRADLTPAAVEARLEEAHRRQLRAGGAALRLAAARSRERQDHELLALARARAGGAGVGGAGGAASSSSTLLPMGSGSSPAFASPPPARAPSSRVPEHVGGGAGVTWVGGSARRGRPGGGGGGGAARPGGGNGGGGGGNGGDPLLLTSAHAQPPSFFRPQRS
jgi:chloride channel 7